MSLSRERVVAAKARADAATEGPWHWVDPETDEPCLPDLPCRAGYHEDHAYRLSLRTVTEYPTAHVGLLPKFIIAEAEEFHEVEAEPGVWMHPDAEFIAAAREDVPVMADALLRVLDIHRREMFGGDAVCSSCLRYTFPMPGRVPYPCATVRAVTGTT